MFFDENHAKVGLTLLMLHEAYARGVSRIELLRGESCFDVLYFFEDLAEKRDTIHNRHWHGLLAVLHMMAADTAFRYLMMGTASSIITADAILNRIEIDRECPSFANARLRALQSELNGPLGLELSFADTRVQITLRRHGDAV